MLSLRINNLFEIINNTTNTSNTANTANKASKKKNGYTIEINILNWNINQVNSNIINNHRSLLLKNNKDDLNNNLIVIKCDDHDEKDDNIDINHNTNNDNVNNNDNNKIEQFLAVLYQQPIPIRILEVKGKNQTCIADFELDILKLSRNIIEAPISYKNDNDSFIANAIVEVKFENFPDWYNYNNLNNMNMIEFCIEPLVSLPDINQLVSDANNNSYVDCEYFIRGCWPMIFGRILPFHCKVNTNSIRTNTIHRFILFDNSDYNTILSEFIEKPINIDLYNIIINETNKNNKNKVKRYLHNISAYDNINIRNLLKPGVTNVQCDVSLKWSLNTTFVTTTKMYIKLPKSIVPAPSRPSLNTVFTLDILKDINNDTTICNHNTEYDIINIARSLYQNKNDINKFILSDQFNEFSRNINKNSTLLNKSPSNQRLIQAYNNQLYNHIKENFQASFHCENNNSNDKSIKYIIKNINIIQNNLIKSDQSEELLSDCYYYYATILLRNTKTRNNDYDNALTLLEHIPYDIRSILARISLLLAYDKVEEADSLIEILEYYDNNNYDDDETNDIDNKWLIVSYSLRALYYYMYDEFDKSKLAAIKANNLLIDNDINNNNNNDDNNDLIPNVYLSCYLIYELGGCLSKLTRYLCDNELQNRPNDNIAHYDIIVLLSKCNEYDYNNEYALNLLEDELSPTKYVYTNDNNNNNIDKMNAYLAIGNRYIQSNQYDKAVSAYRLAYSIDNNNWKVIQGLADSLYYSRQFNEAENLYQELCCGIRNDNKNYWPSLYGDTNNNPSNWNHFSQCLYNSNKIIESQQANIIYKHLST